MFEGQLDECALSVYVCVHALASGGRICLSVCVFVLYVYTGVIFLSLCRLAEVSDQTRSGRMRSREHYTGTHTVAYSYTELVDVH